VLFLLLHPLFLFRYHGLAISAFDLMTMGVAGKVLALPAKSLLKKSGYLTLEMGIQLAGAAGGETAGQLLTQKELDTKQILSEVLGQVFTGGKDVAVGYMIHRKKAGKLTTADAMKSNATEEEVSQMVDISVGIGEITEDQGNEIKTKDAEVKKAQEVIPPAHKNMPNVVDLVIQKQKIQDLLDGLNEEAATADDAFKSLYESQIKKREAELADIDAQLKAAVRESAEKVAASSYAISCCYRSRYKPRQSTNCRTWARSHRPVHCKCGCCLCR